MNRRADQNRTEIQEAKRRKRERILIVLTVLIIVILTFVENRFFRGHVDWGSSDDFLIFGLININIILILFLIFLIVRNVVKLVFERRRGILGSRLRTKLVTAFVSLSLIPTFILFLISINFLSYSIENWFSIKIGNALDQTIELAHLHYQQTEEQAKFYANQISSDITLNQLYDQDRDEFLVNLARLKQKNFKLGYLQISFDNREKNIVFNEPRFPKVPGDFFTPKVREDLYAGKEVAVVKPSAAGDVINVLVPIYSHISPYEVIGYVFVGALVPKEIVDKITVVSNTSEAYSQLRLFKNPIKLNYIITLSIVTLLIVFSATWFGLFLAKGITEPIQDLAEATHKIAEGNLDHRINIVAEDEIGVLVNSFNQMTKDLKKSKENLQLANADLEERRKYMEAVLLHVSAGILSLDRNGIVTTINRAAELMLDIQAVDVLNRPCSGMLTAENMAVINELLDEVRTSGRGVVEKQIELTIRERPLTVLVTITVIHEAKGQNLGMVLVFEDLTQLQKAERAAAWREVARRMAHEIKNPLTPVQLSAQRLQRRYGDKLGDDGQIFQECTDTIISQVEVLKNLVNEFSRYARMPVTTPALNDLNATVHDPILLFQDAHKEIAFEFSPGPDIPPLYLDVEQIRRVMVNLLDNAVAAMNNVEGRIEVTTRYDSEARKALVAVADNGCGVPVRHTAKIFEPYFSTKKSGTGLGLAIVNSIIADHNGSVTVRANVPSGTVVAFELPVPEVAGEHEESRQSGAG
ncbi:MAG TPA: ATP-binding protein [Syntrophales bacterium]|nr:ATP-binding protein [Syntrophales bacterium]HQA82744.1 ATP-binding protein [Syntrophales bacterium]